MDFCISLSDILERIKSNRYNILDLIIEYIIKDKDLRKSIEDEIGKIEPIRQENGMILKIDFNRGGEDPSQPNIFKLYLSGNGIIRIDWGDETSTEVNLADTDVPISHEYEDKKEYEITIYGQEDNPNQEISFGSGSDFSETNKYLKEIVYWGDLNLVSLSGALSRTKDPLTVPEKLPSTVKDLSYLLYDSSVSKVINIQNWDTSNVTNMTRTFAGATEFNQDIGDWDTRNVTDMSRMFILAESFDQYIGDWNTSSVENMESMFNLAKSFNKNIGGWDTSKVENMNAMFFNAENFDQNLSGWCVKLINSKPDNFDTGSKFQGKEDRQPQWENPPCLQ